MARSKKRAAGATTTTITRRKKGRQSRTVAGGQRTKAEAKAKTTANLEHMNTLLRLTELYSTNYDFEASEWFWSKLHQNEIPSTIEEFEKKYPQGGREFQLFERFTSKFELAGLLLEHGFLDENLYFERYGGLQAEWERSKPIIYGIRKQWNEPRFRENFELLTKRGRKWLDKHPPKVDADVKE
jgi:hypothetical protein